VSFDACHPKPREQARAAPLFASTEGDVLLAFTVLGEAKGAGSKQAFRTKTGKMVVTESIKGSKSWQQEVRVAATQAIEDRDGRLRVPAFMHGLLEVPLTVEFTFYKPRPAGHYGTGRNSSTLKASAPHFPATRPDLLKLARACEDALQGVVYRDDAQIVNEVLRKRYGTPARVEVRIYKPQPEEVE
jgi:Holliday junction resolvase RusA-like endonuclease